jgi:CheY-like chemotaxis protein
VITVKPVVLLVDDARLERKINEWTLTQAGYEVICACDGEEGLRVAKEKLPDVILLDLMLPKLSGAEFLRALKSDQTTAGIPAILVSSLPLGSSAKLKRKGAARFLEKSQVIAEGGGKLLIEAIEAVLHPVV